MASHLCAWQPRPPVTACDPGLACFGVWGGDSVIVLQANKLCTQVREEGSEKMWTPGLRISGFGWPRLSPFSSTDSIFHRESLCLCLSCRASASLVSLCVSLFASLACSWDLQAWSLSLCSRAAWGVRAEAR